VRIAHFAQFAPNRCGLYATVRDLVLAEQKLPGVDAGFIDYGDNGLCRAGQRDGVLETLPLEWAYDADVLVRHTAIQPELHNSGKPIIMALHGRPESSYRLEAGGHDNPVLTVIANKAQDERYRAFVTFWPEFLLPWSTIIPQEKLHYVPAPVDLDYYASGTDLHLEGEPKLLIADIWRDDVVPLNALFGAIEFIRKHAPKGKIHLVALPPDLKGVAPVIAQAKRDGYLGRLNGQIRGIRDYYQSCDIVVTPHVIATRIIREALACGRPVVAGAGCQYTPFTANPAKPETYADAIKDCWDKLDGAKMYARERAEKCFHPQKAAAAMLDVCRKVVSTPKQKKLFLDIGAHLGESVHRFYRERRDAGEFDIYCFEPQPANFGPLMANVGTIPNVAVIPAALSSSDGTVPLYCGKALDGEGSTLLKGKQTGQINYGKPVAVRALPLACWLNKHPADYVVVKMNIEGGEYDLIPHLIATGAMAKIDELYVQLHSTKFDLPERMKLDAVEAKWRPELARFKTKVHATVKGMASFGNP
jgi:FkbM family methyltransferase